MVTVKTVVEKHPEGVCRLSLGNRRGDRRPGRELRRSLGGCSFGHPISSRDLRA